MAEDAALVRVLMSQLEEASDQEVQQVFMNICEFVQKFDLSEAKKRELKTRVFDCMSERLSSKTQKKESDKFRDTGPLNKDDQSFLEKGTNFLKDALIREKYESTEQPSTQANKTLVEHNESCSNPALSDAWSQVSASFSFPYSREPGALGDQTQNQELKELGGISKRGGYSNGRMGQNIQAPSGDAPKSKLSSWRGGHQGGGSYSGQREEYYTARGNSQEQHSGEGIYKGGSGSEGLGRRIDNLDSGVYEEKSSMRGDMYQMREFYEEAGGRGQHLKRHDERQYQKGGFYEERVERGHNQQYHSGEIYEGEHSRRAAMDTPTKKSPQEQVTISKPPQTNKLDAEFMARAQSDVKDLKLKLRNAESRIQTLEEDKVWFEQRLTELQDIIENIVRTAESQDFRAEKRFIKERQRGFINGFKWFIPFNDAIRKKINDQKMPPFIESLRTYLPDCSGYCFVFEAYPCGYGSGEGSHLSLYWRLCNDANNPQLVWPFSGRITFYLVPTKPNVPPIIFTTKVLNRLRCFKRPKEIEGDVTEGWGAPRFAFLDFINGDYVRNNRIEVRVSLDL